MRVLLRNKETKAFFKAYQDWTLNPTNAFDCEDTDRAFRLAHELGVKDMALCITTDDGQRLFDVPLGGEESDGEGMSR
jgi:hypothetical protein